MESFLEPLNEIKVLPIIAHNYNNESGLISLDNTIYDIYIDSHYYRRYHNVRRIFRADVANIYRFFRERIITLHLYTEVEILTRVAEFFPLDYSMIWKRLTPDEKARILASLPSHRKHTKQLY